MCIQRVNVSNFCFIPKMKNLQTFDYQSFEGFFSDSAGIRTQGPYIKSVLLYQLSYGICRFEGANIQLLFGYSKEICGKFDKN
jgi:hypothetical protein